ncbi:response regulator [Paenibacillus sp. GCM10012307]|uniref:Response regulator n=1 Tax=Paenibacillus roseus TaxID=2798579 RepID=A0A934J384_9BACL|nr:response regulator [Paenibacillus roseus]MBJ6363946.1 response regulator [Paenibacillus roseus]
MTELMIVDDEPHSVDSLADTIDWASIGICGVHKAYSAPEALDKLKEAPVDIIITDIHMPKMNGLELIEEIRKVWPRTKCIILSGYAEFEFAQKAMQLKTTEYLLKPVLNEEIIEKVKALTEQLQCEWLEISSREQAVRAVKENQSLLRGNLLLEFLYGSQYPRETWERKLELLHLPFEFGDRYNKFMIRLEDGFQSFNQGSRPLLEYAVYNIVEEIFGLSFDVWYGKDDYDYHIFLFKWKGDEQERNHYLSALHMKEDEYIDALFSRIQHNVRVFLKGQLSILAGNWGHFPEQLSADYYEMLTVFRQQIGRESGFCMKLSGYAKDKDVHTLSSLYEPPVLSQLLETGRWQEAEDKLRHIFGQMADDKYKSRDNLIEVYFHIYNAFTYILHRNGRKISEFLGRGLEQLIDGNTYHHAEQLLGRTLRMLRQLQDESLLELKDSRRQTIQDVQRYIENHLAEDVSLQTLSEQVFMHPTYLSKIYKSETGEGINQYIQRLRKDKAIQLLKHTELKIYEIGNRVGLVNTTYFIKQFRKDTGMTPQEFRDSLKG